VGPNQRILDLLAAIITSRGGTVPARVSGEHWNDYVLRCLETVITSGGGTVPDRSGGSWNDRVVQLLSYVADNPQRARVTSRVLADYTQRDPNSLVHSVSNTTTAGGSYLLVALTNSAVGSSLPNLAASWSAPSRDLDGDLADADIFTLQASALVWTDDAPPNDWCIGAVLADAELGTATTGFGIRLNYSGGRWLVAGLVCTGGVWSATPATATSASVVGGRADSSHRNTVNQRTVQACGVASTGVEVGTANTATSAITTTSTDDLDVFAVFAGWMTGSGGSNGSSAKLRGHELIHRLTDISGITR
jgi:hypothetical protein